jgi:undecaprenyl-diphosphatase
MLAFDQFLRAWVVAHRVAALDVVMWTLSVVGRGGMVWLGLAAVIAIRRRKPRVFTSMLLAVLLASALTDNVLKPLFQRDRPFVAMSGDVIGGRPEGASFPSGHSANAFAGAFVLSRIAAPAALVWWTLAAAIAYSRVYLGVHYPLDVIVGALVGVGCGILAMRLTGRTT